MRPLREQGRDTGSGGGVTAQGRYAALADDSAELLRLARGRASDAYHAILATLAEMIEGIRNNAALTPQQKAEAIRLAREQKLTEARAVRKRIMQEAKDKARARRKQRGGTGKAPAPPAPTVH